MQTVKLGEIVDVKKGKKPEVVLDSPCVGSRPCLLIDEVRGKLPTNFTTDVKGVEVTKNDMCIVWDGANAGTVGFGLEGLIGSTVARLRILSQNRWDTGFVGRLLQGQFQSINAAAQGKGATIPHVDKRHLEAIEFPAYSFDEQKRIAAILDQADDIRRKRQHAIDRLNQLGQAIFHEMFGSADRAGWSKTTLAQLCEIQVGFPFKSSDYAEVDGAIRLCRGANVLPGKIEWSDKASLPEPLAKKHLEFSLREGDIVIAMDRPWISSGFKVARIQSEDLPSLLVQRVARLRAIDEQDGEWVHFLVNGAEFQKSCKTTETTIPHISPNDIRKFEFLCPPKLLRHQFHEKIKVLRKAMMHSEISASSVNSLFASLQHRAFTGQL